MNDDEILKQAAIKILNGMDNNNLILKARPSDMRIDVTANNIYRIELTMYASSEDLINSNLYNKYDKIAFIGINE